MYIKNPYEKMFERNTVQSIELCFKKKFNSFLFKYSNIISRILLIKNNINEIGDAFYRNYIFNYLIFTFQILVFIRKSYLRKTFRRYFQRKFSIK